METGGGQNVVALDRALRFARARLSPDITAQRLLILIAVYLHEGLSQRELLHHLDSTSITALSRNIADLSSLTTRKSAGPGLLELRVDPMNLRVKRVFLTRQGTQLRQAVAVGHGSRLIVALTSISSNA